MAVGRKNLPTAAPHPPWPLRVNSPATSKPPGWYGIQPSFFPWEKGVYLWEEEKADKSCHLTTVAWMEMAWNQSLIFFPREVFRCDGGGNQISIRSGNSNRDLVTMKSLVSFPEPFPGTYKDPTLWEGRGQRTGEDLVLQVGEEHHRGVHHRGHLPDPRPLCTIEQRNRLKR